MDRPYTTESANDHWKKRLLNLYANIPEALPEELIESIAEKGTVRIERIVSRGHRSAPGFWYDQPTDECVVLLRGRAGLFFEKSQAVEVMTAGDYRIIPAHEKHRVEWTDPSADTVWLAVHY